MNNMADETKPEGDQTPTNGASAPAQTDDGATQQPAAPKMQVLGQLIRDLSFENVAAQKGTTIEGQPDITVQVGLDARKREQEGTYGVAIKLNVAGKVKGSGETIFAMELDYMGVFKIEGVPDQQLHPYLLIECPRMLFPYVRRIVSDVSRDGGFPPLNLEQIDFVALYRQELQRRAQAQQAEAPAPQA
jgi:preprotein translocase subunit SecB